MHESNNQRNKAIWVGSLALLTIGSVLYFTLFRKPEGSPKPVKEPNSRQVVKEKSIKITQTEETTKDKCPQQDDVPQAKATVTSKQVVDIIDEPVKPIITEQDRMEADTLIAATTDSTRQDKTENENENEEDLEEKSPLLTAAPSTSTSSDISTDRQSQQQQQQQQDTIKLSPPISANTSNTTTTTTTTSSVNGGYWQPPATNTTFQHSMGWPELFPLQQQDDQVKQALMGTKTTDPTKNDPVTPPTTTLGEKKKHTKKRMNRVEQIEQQRQNYVPTMKARCNWWPNCTNKNCKYHHPYQPCRYGDQCIYNERCMFLHSWDYEEPTRQTKQQYQVPIQFTGN